MPDPPGYLFQPPQCTRHLLSAALSAVKYHKLRQLMDCLLPLPKFKSGF